MPAVLKGEREMYVDTPRNYDRNRKYPVLYLRGGSGELASTWNIDRGWSYFWTRRMAAIGGPSAHV